MLSKAIAKQYYSLFADGNLVDSDMNQAIKFRWSKSGKEMIIKS